MSAFLFQNDIKIDLFITSPAKRALKTCEYFAETYKSDFKKDGRLYHPSENDFLSVIYDLQDRANA